MKPLTKAEREALECIRGGVDVFSPVLARTLRDLQKKRPKLLDICQPRAREYNGAGVVPYFGAIITPAGEAALAAGPARRKRKFAGYVRGEASAPAPRARAGGAS